MHLCLLPAMAQIISYCQHGTENAGCGMQAQGITYASMVACPLRASRHCNIHGFSHSQQWLGRPAVNMAGEVWMRIFYEHCRSVPTDMQSCCSSYPAILWAISHFPQHTGLSRLLDFCQNSSVVVLYSHVHTCTSFKHRHTEHSITYALYVGDVA